MIEANQMNACNMCHVDQSIDWTLSHLKDWYGDTFDELAISANYPDRKKSAAIGWMASDKEAVRCGCARPSRCTLGLTRPDPGAR